MKLDEVPFFSSVFDHVENVDALFIAKLAIREANLLKRFAISDSIHELVHVFILVQITCHNRKSLQTFALAHSVSKLLPTTRMKPDIHKSYFEE